MQGLPAGWIVQILDDDQGRLWLTTGKGISSLDKRDLEDVADGRRPRVHASLYDGNDGVLMRADSFGHPAQLPQLFAGFGIHHFLHWRGNGN